MALDELFGNEAIDWELIETHWRDMMRVVASIRAGKVLPSTLLRKLGNYSPKNRLYKAFRELGRAVRTEFLLRFLSSMQLRRQITAATNKAESYNGFSKWLLFGGDGIVPDLDPEDREKRLKFNQLLADSLVLQNAADMTGVLRSLAEGGYPLRREEVAQLSPYLREHVKRFGDYVVDLEAVPDPLHFEMPELSDCPCPSRDECHKKWPDLGRMSAARPPVVSTTSISGAGTCSVKSPSAYTVPAAPRMITAERGPSPRSFGAAARAPSTPSTFSSSRKAASCSLTTSGSSFCKTFPGSSIGGARFTRARVPTASAACTARPTVSAETSIWATRTFDSPIIPEATSPARRLRLAPGATVMAFSPSGVTVINAAPVDSSGAASTNSVSTPFRRRASTSGPPSSSSPTRPSMETEAPSRPAAAAWFAPLPPLCRESAAFVTFLTRTRTALHLQHEVLVDRADGKDVSHP